MSLNAANALFYSVSGLRGTGRTALHKELTAELPRALGLRRHDCAFLPNPFKHLPHPILWGEELRLRPVSLMYMGWADLNEYTETVLIPALKTHKIVVSECFGLDLVLRATATSNTRHDDDAVITMHEYNVRARLKEMGVETPTYVITRTETEADTSKVVAYLRETIPAISNEDARAHIDRENGIIDRYFHDKLQKQPFYLNASKSHKEMGREAIEFIHTHFTQNALAA